jgi:hypothetical protein
MSNLATFAAQTLGDALVYELMLLIGLVLVINIRNVFVVVASRIETIGRG